MITLRKFACGHFIKPHRILDYSLNFVLVVFKRISSPPHMADVSFVNCTVD